MAFNTQYAILFGLAGFAASAYHIKVGDEVKAVPIIGFAVCVLYSLAKYNFAYGFLTGIEYAVGFGIAHAIFKKNITEKKSLKKNEDC
jgi:hypothetical protein